ncbi:hypothetical protein Zmor_005364 [Zophobas morio]|uniref:Uncharacterized protein n=1 Tax=Zophobas morio TaxID=2755281 RepID=A0AA38MM73_9CUCU|nr:hypothetical protein Zmor_005364 [Zophobas morio]
MESGGHSIPHPLVAICCGVGRLLACSPPPHQKNLYRSEWQPVEQVCTTAKCLCIYTESPIRSTPSPSDLFIRSVAFVGSIDFLKILSPTDALSEIMDGDKRQTLARESVLG